jgi:hypothetical protein
VIYAHTREGTATETVRPVTDGEVSLTVQAGSDGALEALVRMRSDGRERELHPFPISAGNPLLISFLEMSLRAMANATGGSPFYIRNRIKDTFRNEGEVAPVEAMFNGERIEADEVVFAPFATDANRGRMGAFADLTLRFVMARSAPGGFLSLSAVSGLDEDGTPAFREEMVLQSYTKGN